MGSRVDRLAAHLRSSPTAERAMAGRVGGALWLIAAVATIALPLFPQVSTPLWPWPLLWTAGALAWGLSALFLVDWPRAPGWVLPAASAAAVAVIALITAVTGGVDSPARLYVFFALVYAGCFLTARQAVAMTVACAAVWALPVLGHRGWPSALGEFAMALPIFAVIGGILAVGRRLLAAMHDGALRLSEEHHALRSIATAVAAGRPVEVLCDLAAEQAARLLGAAGCGILRFEPDDHVTTLGAWQASGAPLSGRRFPLGAGTPIAQLHRDARPVRVDELHAGPEGDTLRAAGYRSMAATPVFVRGRLWGAVVVSATPAGAFPPATETHLGEFAELIGMAVANTEEAQRLQDDATTDPLTGLANHRAFQERLRDEVTRAARHDRVVAVALVDVDDFKAVNDAGGHAAGDEVLRAIAGHLRDHLRGEDVLARVGGDEFAVLLPESGATAAAAALERARRAIERAPFAGGAHLTISAGVCDVAHAHDAGELTRLADGALYWSKEHGRNRVSIYDPATIRELSEDERRGQLQRSQALAGIRALARAIDARDPSTRGHSERVAELAARLAEERGWPAERVALLHEAALVHDVGKLVSPGASHAALSARMVEDLLSPEQVAWILGEAPSEGAALLAAADASVHAAAAATPA